MLLHVCHTWSPQGLSNEIDMFEKVTKIGIALKKYCILNYSDFCLFYNSFIWKKIQVNFNIKSRFK